jgi:hypothetical protein
MDNLNKKTFDSEVDKSKIRFFELLAYLSTSARGLVYEPKLYGPLRLLEAVDRLIDLMDELELADEELITLANKITTDAMMISTNPNYCVKVTDDLSLLFANRLRQYESK